MPHIGDKRYAVVSCHVERPLDDALWRLFLDLRTRTPGGFAIAALLRPPDLAAGEHAGRWLERAREAQPDPSFVLGYHAHFGGPEQARPADGAPAERVRRELDWLATTGLELTLYSGGGWYADVDVAEQVAGAGYADCTATAFRPSYLADDAPRLELAEPARLVLPSGATLLEFPSTHSLGMLARGFLGPLPRYVHVYFHDTDLADANRRRALLIALRVLGRRRRPAYFGTLREDLAATAPEIPFAAVARGQGAVTIP